MSDYVIDIRTRVLPEAHQIFVARPGKDYALYKEVVESSTVLVDLPWLQIENSNPIDDMLDLSAQIHRARAVQRWVRSKEGDAPSMDLDDYRDIPDRSGFSQLKGAIKGIFERAQKGDLVIVPPSNYSSNAWIGEFEDAARGINYVNIERRSYRADYVGRRVNWIATIPRRKLSAAIIDIITKPNIFVSIPKSEYDGIYNIAYSAFAIGDRYGAKFDVDGDFTSRSDFIIQAFFNFSAVNTGAVIDGDRGISTSIREAGFASISKYTPDLKANVNSPGSLSLRSGYIVPLVAAVQMVLATEIGDGAPKALAEGRITIGNSLAPENDPCTDAVRKANFESLQLLELDKWPDACRLMKEAAEGAKLNSPAKLVKSDDP